MRHVSLFPPLFIYGMKSFTLTTEMCPTATQLHILYVSYLIHLIMRTEILTPILQEVNLALQPRAQVLNDVLVPESGQEFVPNTANMLQIRFGESKSYSGGEANCQCNCLLAKPYR